MNTTVVLRRNFKGVSRCYGARARISSFVDLGVPTPYQLPLALVPPVSASSYSPEGKESRQRSFDRFQDHPRRKTTALNCHVNVLPKDVRHHESRIVFTSHVASQNTAPSRHLQESAPKADSEPPRAEKPKWEDEQYPDIGKSIPQL